MELVEHHSRRLMKHKRADQHLLFIVFISQKCKSEFGSIAELIEHYSTVGAELPCALSCARVNHCYEWEEANKQQPARKRVPSKPRNQHPHGK